MGFFCFVGRAFGAIVAKARAPACLSGTAAAGSYGAVMRKGGMVKGIVSVMAGALLGPASAFAAAPPAPVTAPAAVATTAPLKPYRINPGDEIEIYVWGDERLQRVLKVLPDGSVSFPLVGRIDALNKLPTDLEGVIAAGLADQYRNTVPRVTVSVKNPSGLSFSVAGKVRAPGAFTPGHYVNVLEAISVAGGPTEFADLSRVKIYRKQGSQIQVIDVRLDTAMKGSPSAADLRGAIVELQSGDTVVVP